MSLRHPSPVSGVWTSREAAACVRYRNQNSQLLDQFIDVVLQKVLEGTIDQARARQSLKKACELIAAGNASVASFLESEIYRISDQGSRRY